MRMMSLIRTRTLTKTVRPKMSAIVTLFPTVSIERCYDEQDEKPAKRFPPAPVTNLSEVRRPCDTEAPCDTDGDDAA